MKSFFSNTPKFYSATMFMSIIGFFLSLANFAIPGNIFWPLSFYFPILWGLWLCCVFLQEMERRNLKLLCLWCLIDVSILFFLTSTLSNEPKIFSSQGAEMVLVLIYFPIIVPTIFLPSIVPEKIAFSFAQMLEGFDKFLALNANEAISSWLALSIVGLVQSFIFYLLINYILSSKKIRAGSI